MSNDEYISEKQMLFIDLFILKTLKEVLLHQNLGYIDVRKFVDDNFLNEANCIMEDIEMRIMYNYGMGFLELFEINEKDISIINEKCKEKNIDPMIFFENNDTKTIFKKDLFYKYFLEVKITALGLKHIEELEMKHKELSGINFIFKKFAGFGELFGKLKYIFGIILTGILIIFIFIFDVKVSEYIKKIPILSSIINTELLESFEKVNESDEFYKNMTQKINETGILGSMKSEDKKNDNILNFSSKNIFKNIMVKNISSNEKIFKINLYNGEIKYINVIKDKFGKFHVKLPNELLNFKIKK